MESESDSRSGWLAPVSIAIQNIIIFIAVLTVPLTVAQQLGLSAEETSSWLLAAYGLTGIAGLILAIVYRQPLLITGNLFALIFIASLGQEFSFAELIGAFIVAGAAVLLLSALGLTRRLAAWLPASIVFGLLARAIIPFISRIFTSVSDAPLLAGIAATVPAFIPRALLVTLAGLAVVGVLINALQEVTKGPLVLGPVFAFAISLSEISFLGFGPFFWALVVGTAISLLLEPEQFKQLRTTS